MKGPIVSIDVSKGKSDYQAFKNLNVKYTGSRSIKHTKEGFDEIVNLVREMEKKLETEVCVVYEATGVYHRVLKKVLEDNNIKQFIINPLLSAKTRKNDSLRCPKTDKLDPKSIAKTYYSHSLHNSHKQETIYHELRELSRYYEDILVHIRKDKVAFRAQLDIVFPGYDTLYDDLYGPVALAVIENYPHPEMLQKKKINTVSKVIQNKTCHRQAVSDTMADRAIEYSKTIYSGCDKDDIEVLILQRFIKKLKEDMAEAERTIGEMIKLAQGLPDFSIIKSIPGIGDNLAARIIAELGDMTRFKKKNELVAFAGLDPRISESGQNDGNHMHITKKGNKRLRCLLYLAVTCSIRLKRDDNSIKDFYIKKKQQSNPMCSKAAKTACASKLVRIIYSMCKTGELYQYNK
ncbi:Transposase IS116/IS110/IS902 family protein [Kandleria vitulina]|jgi:transposase|uniref:IS110 family transposase n=1 Tax=Kandleria vitulina TaxID=1630 RepID=UPI0008AFDAE9|nr:IS110 family transposase [Kandleria vitulina]SEJ28155.1 Transposase IS116/IS110/IS902 family protein [Kandleria vitulina]